MINGLAKLPRIFTPGFTKAANELSPVGHQPLTIGQTSLQQLQRLSQSVTVQDLEIGPLALFSQFQRLQLQVPLLNRLFENLAHVRNKIDQLVTRLNIVTADPTIGQSFYSLEIGELNTVARKQTALKLLTLNSEKLLELQQLKRFSQTALDSLNTHIRSKLQSIGSAIGLDNRSSTLDRLSANLGAPIDIRYNPWAASSVSQNTTATASKQFQNKRAINPRPQRQEYDVYRTKNRKSPRGKQNSLLRNLLAKAKAAARNFISRLFKRGR